MNAPALDITVCMATYRRLPQLELLLADLAAQTLPPRQIVVVDNDAAASARPVVEAHRAALQARGIALDYAVQPEKSISLTRNMTVQRARSAWLAFIDDDERAPPQWLALLSDSAHRFGADGVLAPVLPVLPPHAPAWLRRGHFYEWARFPTGTELPGNALRLGNALLSMACLNRLRPLFDPVYGLTGGEDGDMLLRLRQTGARLIWCDEAAVTEPVTDERMRVGWLLRRALRGGQDFALHFLRGKLNGPPGAVRILGFYGRAVLQMVVAGALALMLWPLGRHHAVHWLARAYANYGKLSLLWGARHHEYA
ncbi:glycosyltransferase family 2 protein [Bordetella avium]|uniref:glycosyltransferase family 2 protein n=1 Tax=Bordetella avium TaxID=521 RepID=UPI000E0C8983|nr:glycosyltransferase [Bordetella avium]AZY49987.1 capsular biosynthesis protein [Bordetella avium]RIQ13054.1 glycosyltransferase [Bordetella avium]RIQ33828.1 glycosyltransferase [Bordetella avium]RIQ37620.1 glycosyltransferase [Bordetella avium]RIQ42254.1 glycosyltransferase [Bordetella avium]